MGKLKLNVEDREALAAALSALDGYGEGENRVVYKFSQTTRLKLAKALAKVTASLNEYKLAQSALIRQVNPKNLKLDQPDITPEERRLIQEGIAAVEKLRQESIAELVLPDLKAKELEQDDQAIPIVVLAGLDSLLKG